jgi:hypothetical protein
VQRVVLNKDKSDVEGEAALFPPIKQQVSDLASLSDLPLGRLRVGPVPFSSIISLSEFAVKGPFRTRKPFLGGQIVSTEY